MMTGWTLFYLTLALVCIWKIPMWMILTTLLLAVVGSAVADIVISIIFIKVAAI
jgi:hypothetical protein